LSTHLIRARRTRFQARVAPLVTAPLASAPLHALATTPPAVLNARRIYAGAVPS
jgi:hypothetical protein